MKVGEPYPVRYTTKGGIGGDDGEMTGVLTMDTDEFLEENNIPLNSFQQNIAEFQWEPKVVNKTVKPVEIIEIGKPYVTSNGTSN